MAKEFAENTTETSATINVCGQKGEVGYKTSTNYEKYYDYRKQENDNQTRVELKQKELEIAKINADKEVEIRRIALAEKQVEAEIVKTNAAKEVEMRRIEKEEKIETRNIEMEEKVRVAAEIYKQNQAKFEAEKTNAAREALTRRIETAEKVRVAEIQAEIYKPNEIELLKLHARQVKMRKIAREIEEAKTKELNFQQNEIHLSASNKIHIKIHRSLRMLKDLLIYEK